MEQDIIKIAIDDLENRKKELENQLKKIDKAINELRNKCQHEFEPVIYNCRLGKYKKCVCCGFEQWAQEI